MTRTEIPGAMQKVFRLGRLAGLEQEQVHRAIYRASKELSCYAGCGDSNPVPARLAAGLEKNLLDNPMLVAWGLKVAASVSDRVWQRFAGSFLRGLVLGRKPTLAAGQQQLGHPPPITLVLNPTMRCSLRCTGCYAYSFDRKADMDRALLERVLGEARELGIRFIVVTGGEPYLYPDLEDVFAAFPDLIFMTYTNGQHLDAARVARLAELGNVWPAVSVEGYEEETDARRGRGVYAKLIAAMARMREQGLMFGISATPTRHNAEVLADDRFLDHYIERGALFGWMFSYMPVGRRPDPGLMPLPEQRDRLRRKSLEWRRSKAFFLADFWNDGPLCGGCLSASRYAYVTPDGWVQPCTFVHFSTHNLKQHSLREIFETQFFRSIRSRQPYSRNLLRPCKIIDHPEVLREVVAECGARPTCPGAEAIVNDPGLRAFLDRYSREYGALADRAWAGPDYDSGRDVCVPFFGREDLYRIFPDRMSAAGAQPDPAAPGAGSSPRAATTGSP